MRRCLPTGSGSGPTRPCGRHQMALANSEEPLHVIAWGGEGFGGPLVDDEEGTAGPQGTASMPQRHHRSGKSCTHSTNITRSYRGDQSADSSARSVQFRRRLWAVFHGRGHRGPAPTARYQHHLRTNGPRTDQHRSSRPRRTRRDGRTNAHRSTALAAMRSPQQLMCLRHSSTP